MAKIEELGTILGIWAHPDDEAYLSGGLMALARAGGSRVVCVTATRGELGTPDPERWPPDRLAAERTAELQRCLDILGVTEHRWLSYQDGGCAAADPAPAVAELRAIIADVRPDTVLTFGPDGITGHSDHQAVSAWATAAFHQATVHRAVSPGARLLHSVVSERRGTRWADLDGRLGVFQAGYPRTVPDDRLALDLVLDPDTVTRKVRALRAQATQTAGLIELMGLDTYTEWVSDETFVTAPGT